MNYGQERCSWMLIKSLFVRGNTRKESITNKINAKSFDVFRVQQKLLELLKAHKFGKNEFKTWKKDTLFKIQCHSYRYIFNKQMLTPDEQKIVENTLRQAWKTAFRECWHDIRFYLTWLKIKNNANQYKKYLCLKNKLEKKGMLSWPYILSHIFFLNGKFRLCPRPQA